MIETRTDGKIFGSFRGQQIELKGFPALIESEAVKTGGASIGSMLNNVCL